ncbi:MAG: nitronate monooxygenase [Bdellovibrionales bacterium]
MAQHLETAFTSLLNINYPIIGAPMFLVSNEDMVVNISEAGAIGTIPSLNFRPADEFRNALGRIKKRTSKPIGVNLIVNKSNTRQQEDLKACLDHGVELYITSLGNPKTVIEEAHKQGTKVFCDVTNLEHAKKVQDLGADGVIAVGQGAGGHAGPITPLVLIPWLKAELNIPIVAAGGIANGQTMAAALALGASAVHVGTRFIASQEARSVGDEYIDAIVDSSPEDIVLSDRVSGTPCNFIRTEYFEQVSENMPFLLREMKKHPISKKYVVPAIHYLGMKALEKSVGEKPDRKKFGVPGKPWASSQKLKPANKSLTILSKSIKTSEKSTLRKSSKRKSCISSSH